MVCDSKLNAAEDNLTTSVSGLKTATFWYFAWPPPILSTISITDTSALDNTTSMICGPRFITSKTASLVLGTIHPGSFCGRGYFSMTLSNCLSLGCLRKPQSKIDANESCTLAPNLSPLSKNWAISAVVFAYLSAAAHGYNCFVCDLTANCSSAA